MATACCNLEKNGGGGGHVARKCHDIYLQECIPVGCIPPALYHTGGKSLSGGGSLSRGSLSGGSLSRGGGICPGVRGSLSRERGVSVRETPVDRQTPVKLLACPKLSGTT